MSYSSANDFSETVIVQCTSWFVSDADADAVTVAAAWLAGRATYPTLMPATHGQHCRPTPTAVNVGRQVGATAWNLIFIAPWCNSSLYQFPFIPALERYTSYGRGRRRPEAGTSCVFRISVSGRGAVGAQGG